MCQATVSYAQELSSSIVPGGNVTDIDIISRAIHDAPCTFGLRHGVEIGKLAIIGAR